MLMQNNIAIPQNVTKIGTFIYLDKKAGIKLIESFIVKILGAPHKPRNVNFFVYLTVKFLIWKQFS